MRLTECTIILALFGLSSAIESVASPGQIAYAISQNYDQTGPGEVDQQSQQRYAQSTLSNLQQTQPQVFTQQPYEQQQQQQQQQQPQQPKTVSYSQPLTYNGQSLTFASQQQQPLQYQQPQSIYGRFQASHGQAAPVSFAQVQLSTTPVHSPPSLLSYQQPQQQQIRYTQPSYKQQPQYAYTLNLQNAEVPKSQGNSLLGAYTVVQPTTAQYVSYQPKQQLQYEHQPTYYSPKGAYSTPVVMVKPVYQQVTKPIFSAPLAKFSLSASHQPQQQQHHQYQYHHLQ